MRYYIADNHFWHGRMNKAMDKRGFRDVQDMNEYMIDRWNSRVRRNDEVVILGDLSIGKAEETNKILKQLKGKLFMIEGNHDKFLSQKETDFARFQWIKPYKEIKDNGRKIICCHYPIVCYNGQFRMKDGKPTTFMLHGHIHRTSDIKGLRVYKDFVAQYSREIRGKEEKKSAPCQIINCFCMFSDYVPLTLDEWIEIDNARVDEASMQEDWSYK